MGQVLGIVYRAIASHLIKAAGYHHATAQTGAVTLIDGAPPCAPPFGRPAVVQIGSPADLSALRQRAELEHPLDVHGRTNAACAWMRRSGPNAFPRRCVCDER